MTTETENAPDTQMHTPEAPERLGFFGKLWNLYVDPRKTFASIGGGHEWIILWLIIGAVSIAGYYPMKDIVKTAKIAEVEKSLAGNPGIDAAKKQEIMDNMSENFDNPIWVALIPVFQLVAIVIVTAILLFVANIVLGGNTQFLPMLNAYAWTGMLVLLGSLVVVPLIVAKGSMDVSLGLGVLTSADTSPFLKKILTSFELFGLWQVWLSATAVSVLSKAPMGKSFTAVFVAWIVWVLAQAGLSTIGFNLGT